MQPRKLFTVQLMLPVIRLSGSKCFQMQTNKHVYADVFSGNLEECSTILITLILIAILSKFSLFPN